MVNSEKEDLRESFQDTDNPSVLMWNNTPIGLYSCREDNDLTDSSIMIFNVCLTASKRGKGIGKLLMLDAVKHCKKPGQDLTLLVYKDDTDVIALYKKLGFKHIEPSKMWPESFAYFNKFLMKFSP